MSYLHPITINNKPYILGIGSQTNYSTWESFMKLSLFDISNPSAPRLVTSFRDAGSYSYSSASYDFVTVRYFDSKLIIPVSKAELIDEATSAYELQEWFAVYDISKESIALAFEVLHSAVDSYYAYPPCYNEAEVPARSFVFQSKLTTVMGHTVISTELESGTYISELDLDVGFNYSVCEPGDLYYYDYMYQNEVYGASNATQAPYHDDESAGAGNATDSCNLPDYVQADIVDSCSETEYTSRSWVFEPNSTYCDGGYVEDVQSNRNVSSAEECAQTCVEEYDGKEASSVVGFWYGCDGKCVW
jgi:hypothetical protein